MRIIISPAKKMNVDTDSLPVRDFPAFLERTEEIYRELQSKSPEELQKLWKCNDQIAALNAERLQKMDLRRNLPPAVLAYEGIQYQYMAPNVFTNRGYDYIQEHPILNHAVNDRLCRCAGEEGVDTAYAHLTRYFRVEAL